KPPPGCQPELSRYLQLTASFHPASLTVHGSRPGGTHRAKSVSRDAATRSVPYSYTLTRVSIRPPVEGPPQDSFRRGSERWGRVARRSWSSVRCGRVSEPPLRGSIKDCSGRPLRWRGRCGRAPFQSRRHDKTASFWRQTAPGES